MGPYNSRMPTVCAANPFVSQPRLKTVFCLSPWVAGCTSQVDPLSAAASTALALVAVASVAALSAALAQTRLRGRHRDELRQCRQQLRLDAQLRSAWTWQTASDHRVLSWLSPAHAPALACVLFESPDRLPLQTRLDSHQAFEKLRLDIQSASPGFRIWEVSGLPLHDDTGAFAGFTGTARPIEEEEERDRQADALVTLLAAQPLPTLVAWNSTEGLRVKHFNEAASALWPSLEGGHLLTQVMAQTPEAAMRAGQLLPGSAPTQVQGWRLQALPKPPHSTPHEYGVLLMRVAQDEVKATSGLQAESDTFSFTLSHDLRAPIRVVEGFTRIVKEDYGKQLDRVGNDHLDRVLGAATRMNLMIDALLTLARLSQQPLASQRVNLSQLAGFVADDLRRSAPERDAQIDIEPQLTAWGDPTLLRLVLENLLSNAWKYCGRCPQTRISFGMVQHGERPAFVVRDNGAGFDMRSADRLFGLFQRLHSASDFPGHGVGLASVRRIVQRHGGDIWAEAEPGVGAAFYFTLAA